MDKTWVYLDVAIFPVLKCMNLDLAPFFFVRAAFGGSVTQMNMNLVGRKTGNPN